LLRNPSFSDHLKMRRTLICAETKEGTVDIKVNLLQAVALQESHIFAVYCTFRETTENNILFMLR